MFDVPNHVTNSNCWVEVTARDTCSKDDAHKDAEEEADVIPDSSTSNKVIVVEDQCTHEGGSNKLVEENKEGVLKGALDLVFGFFFEDRHCFSNKNDFINIII